MKEDKCSLCGFVIEDEEKLYCQGYNLVIEEKNAMLEQNKYVKGDENPVVIAALVLCVKCKRDICFHLHALRFKSK